MKWFDGFGSEVSFFFFFLFFACFYIVVPFSSGKNRIRSNVQLLMHKVQIKPEDHQISNINE